jgi:amino acid transporter
MAGDVQTPAPASDSLDVSKRDDIQYLKRHAMGLAGVVFIAVASEAPITGQLGNVPFAVAFGNGTGAPAGFLFATIVLAIFCVGYAAMARKLTAVGGFYSFISHGLGRELGFAAGWSSVAAYAMVETSVIGAFAYFANITIKDHLGVSISWPIIAVAGIALVGILSYLDIRVNTRVLGVALILEVLILGLMDVFVFAKGGVSGIHAGPVNMVNAFKGLAPGVGIFFAFWSWVGFEVVPNYAEESKDPKRIGTAALYISVVATGIFFTLTAWAAVSGHSQAINDATKDPGNFYYSVTTAFVGTWATDIMQILIITGSFACALAFHNTASRYFYAIGRERVFNPAFGRTHPKWHSPHVASTTQTGVAFGLLLLFLLLYAGSKAVRDFAGGFATAPYFELYGWLAIAATFWVLLNQTICSIAVITYFRRPENQGEFGVWSTVIAPFLAVVTQAGVLWLLWVNITTLGGNLFIVKAIPWFCVGWFVVGLIVAFYFKSRRPEKYAIIGRMVNEGV